MSYEKSINIFTAVIKDQPQLFSAADSEELKKIAADLPTNLEEIWGIISPWLEAHPAIKKAFATKYVPDKTFLGPDLSKPQEAPEDAAGDTALRDKLINEMIQHQPLDFPNLDSANQPPKTK